VKREREREGGGGGGKLQAIYKRYIVCCLRKLVEYRPLLFSYLENHSVDVSASMDAPYCSS